MFRKFQVILLLGLFLSGVLFSTVQASSAEEEYDPQNTMLALNMAVVSIYTITSTGDRIILDQEYRNILNNLSIGNIEGDYEIIDLYERILDIITYEKLRDDESKLFDAAYERNVKNNMLRAASGIRAYGGSLWSFLGSLLTSATSSYFDYRFSKEEYQADLDESLWGLERERVLDINDLRKQLLRSSWRLLRQYGLPDEYRVTEENLKLFTQVVDEQNPKKALIMFDSLKKDFQAYPPFWYFYGHAAQELGNTDLARKCYDTFDEVYRKVLRRDPFLVEVCKNKIFLLNLYTEQEEIRNCARLIAENSSPQDWLNNLIAGVQFYLLGEKDQARRYVQQNVAFESEVDLSNMLLEAMASGNLQKNELSEMLQKFIQVILPPAEKLAAKGKGREALAHGLELYFQSEYARALEYFKVSAGEEIPLGFYMCCRAYNLGQGNEKDLGASGRYRKRFDQAIEKGTEGYEENAELIQRYAGEGNPDAQFLWGRMHGNGYGVPQSYAEAVKWYRKAAEQGDAEAQYSLGQMYENGRGVPQSDTEAVKWYRKVAEQGDAEAQYSLGQMYGNGRGVPQDMETAYMWFYVAASKGFRPAQDTVDDLDGKGLFNRKKLSSEEIARAKQRARDFLTKQSIMDPENRTKNQTKKWGRNAGTSHRNSR